MPTVLLYVGLRSRLFTPTDLGLTTQVCGARRPWLLLALSVVVPFAFWKLDISVVAWALATLPNGWPVPSFRYTDVIPPPGPGTGFYRLLALVHLCITAGVVEELYYRAAMDRLFPRGWRAGAAYVLVSSLVFAGAHEEGGLRSVTEAFAVGILAATVFRLTGNVWPLIVGHIITDWYWFTGGPAAG